MVRVLAVSDEVVERLWRPTVRRHPRPELVLAAGDLPFDYLEYLLDRLSVPLVYVPGNHDPDVSGRRVSRAGLVLRAGLPSSDPGPAGADNADGGVLDAAGLRIAGLGGSLRYRKGPNQWSQEQMARRGRRLVRRAHRLRRRDGRGVDVLLTHAPPLGCGDGDDPPHHGFAALHDVVAALSPRLLLHGHIHPYGQHLPDRTIGTTRVVNVVGAKTFEVPDAVAEALTAG